jgi:hypothetical protein
MSNWPGRRRRVKMNNLCQGCRITRDDFDDHNAVCNHEGAKQHCLPPKEHIREPDEQKEDTPHGYFELTDAMTAPFPKETFTKKLGGSHERQP